MLKKLLPLLLLLILIDTCYAATIHGSIYDLSLDLVSDVIVEIDTIPVQRFISKEGTYSLNVPAGHYKITAKQVQSNITLAFTEEELEVVDEGEYVLDLFLFPSFEEEELLYEEPEMDLPEDYLRTTNTLLIIVIILLSVFLIVIAYLFFRSKKPKQIVVEGDDELEKVISIIKSHGGRTTQKEIRKQLPLSEAKVSLIISELEAKDVVQKIKKGRGNIIILKRK